VPNETSKNVVIRIKAESSPQTAAAFAQVQQGAQNASRDVKKAEDALSKMGVPARSTAQIVSSLFLQSQKDAQAAGKRIDDLSQQFKKLGLSVKDVQGISKDLAKQFDLTSAQIEKAAAQAQGGMAGFSSKLGGMMGGLKGIGMGAGIGVAAVGAVATGMGRYGESSLRNREMRDMPNRFTDMEWAEQAHPAYSATPGGETVWGWGTSVGKAIHGKQIHAANMQRRGVEAGQSALLEREERRGREIGVTAPVVERQRQMTEAGAGAQSEVKAEGLGKEFARDYRKSAEAFGKQLTDSQRQAAPMLYRGVAGLQLQENAQAMGRFGEAAGERLGQGQAQVTESKEGHDRATAQLETQQRKLQEIIRLREQGSASEAELVHQQQLAEQAAQRELEMRQRLMDATREQGTLQKDISRAWRDMITEQHKAARATAVIEREKVKDKTAELATMDPFRKQQILNVARKLKAGLGHGHGPQLRMVGGRMQMMPGTGSGMTEEELGVARQHMPELLRKESLKLGEKDPLIEQIRKEVPEFEGKAKEAEAVEKQLGTVKAEIDAKVTLDDKNMQDQAEKMAQSLIQRVQGALEQLKSGLEIKLAQSEHTIMMQKNSGR
jgi:hypothetical protein